MAPAEQSQQSPAAPGWKRLRRWAGTPVPVGFVEMLKVGVAAGLAVFLAGWSGGALLGGGAMPLLASMGASVVILFAVPHSPMARPWAVIGGHGLSCVIGVSCAQNIADLWSAAGLAVGVSVFAMHLARCLHPPGGATALVMVLGGEGVRSLGYQFLLTPLALNLAVLLLLAHFYARSRRSRGLAAQPHVSPVDPSPLERLGVRPEDLRAALHEHGAFVDVSEGELSEIYQLAAGHAQRRAFGARTCAAIMSRDVVAVGSARV
jgi:CBS domain-containing membrane protein